MRTRSDDRARRRWRGPARGRVLRFAARRRGAMRKRCAPAVLDSHASHGQPHRAAPAHHRHARIRARDVAGRARPRAARRDCIRRRRRSARRHHAGRSRSLDQPLADIGGKGLFIKELEVAMADGRADLAVHSLKDVPMDMPEGFTLAAISAREDPRDAFVSNHYSISPSCRAARASARRACAAKRSCASAIRCWRSCRCAATSTRGCASSTRASTTRSSSPPRV